MPGTVVLEDLLDAFDGEALVVEQVADALEEQHVLGTVVAASAAPFQGFDGRKTRLPKAQDVLRQIELVGGF